MLPEDKKLEEETQNTRSVSNPHKFKPDYSTTNSDKDFKVENKVVGVNLIMKNKKV